jgi:hypothetical protein
MDREVKKFLDTHGGVASVNQMADLLDLDEGSVRRWARENDVRRIGSTFAFDREAAAACADDLLAGDEEDEDDNEQDEDELHQDVENAEDDEIEDDDEDND